MSKKNKEKQIKSEQSFSKFSFEGVYNYNEALTLAFFPDGFPDDMEKENEDVKFKSDIYFSLWNMFLLAAGWSEDEYFAACEAFDELDEASHSFDDEESNEGVFISNFKENNKKFNLN